MNKNKKPKLRFVEFKNDEDWEEGTLSEICNITNGKANAQDHTEEGIYPLFDRSEVVKLSNEYIFDTEAVIIPGEGMKFIPKYYKGKFNLHQRAYALKDFKCDGEFVYHFMVNNSNLLSRKAVQSTVLSLRKPILETFPILLPPTIQEQQKIADCLISLDELIEAQEEKLRLLKEHKKGLLQQLFPQVADNENIVGGGKCLIISKLPKIRFPEFSGEWQEKTLGEVSKIFKGKGISKLDIVEKGNNPCIRYGELYTYYGEIIKEIKSYTNLDKDNLVLSKINDVIIPSSGETQEDIATASCVMLDNVALGGDLNIIRSEVNGVFLSYYLNSSKKREIAKIAQGIAVVHLYSEQLKGLKILLPPTPEEQQKIANCLTSLDEIIETQNQNIENLKTHKKGLLQQLFPSVA